MSEEIQQQLRTFIVEEIFGDSGMEVPADMPLLSGFLDSFGLMQLLNFIEDTYDDAIANREVVDENFASLEAVAAFVGRKLAGKE